MGALDHLGYLDHYIQYKQIFLIFAFSSRVNIQRVSQKCSVEV